MHIKTKIVFTKSIITKATFKFWLRYSLVKLIFSISCILVSTLFLAFSEMNKTLAMLLLILAGILMLIYISIYPVYKKRSLSNLNKMQDPTYNWEFTDKNIKIEAEIAQSTFKWEAIKKVWLFNNIWLLFFSNNSYSIFLADKLTNQEKTEILSHFKNKAIKIKDYK